MAYRHKGENGRLTWQLAVHLYDKVTVREYADHIKFLMDRNVLVDVFDLEWSAPGEPDLPYDVEV